MTANKIIGYAIPSLTALLVCATGCGGGTQSPEPQQTIQTEQGEVPAPPPGGETEIKTEDSQGNEKKTTIETETDD
jgi:hypothetical protein